MLGLPPAFNLSHDQTLQFKSLMLKELNFVMNWTQIGGAAVHRQQALVLINEHDAKSEDVVQLAHHVRQKVGEKFNVWLEPEVRFIGASGEVSAVETIS